jgi:hypothetical protein
MRRHWLGKECERNRTEAQRTNRSATATDTAARQGRRNRRRERRTRSPPSVARVRPARRPTRVSRAVCSGASSDRRSVLRFVSYLQTGPVALTSLLTFGALSSLAPPGSNEYVELGILLALAVGVIRIGVGVLRAGVVAYLVSRPVIVGFVPAAAVLIVATQVPAAFGVPPEESGILESALSVLAHPSAWSPSAVVLASATLALMAIGKAIHGLFPAALVPTVLGLVYSEASGYGGATVGSIPHAFLHISLDLAWGQLPTLLLAGSSSPLSASSSRCRSRERMPRWTGRSGMPTESSSAKGLLTSRPDSPEAFPLGVRSPGAR